MDSGNRGFNHKQKIKKYSLERTIRSADRRIAELQCELQRIQKEKEEIEWELEVHLRGKKACMRKLGLVERE